MKVTSESFEREVLQAKGKVLLDLYADWCGPCRMLSPILEEIAGERSDVKLCKVNVDEEAAIAARFGVSAIPMLVLLENGEVLAKTLGYRPKEEVLAFIDEN